MGIRIDFNQAVSPTCKSRPRGGHLVIERDTWPEPGVNGTFSIVFGVSDLYDQSMYWPGEEGWYLLTQMTRSHRINCVRMMLRNAVAIQIAYIMDRPNPAELLQGEHALDAAEAEEERWYEETMLNKTPKQWLRQTPLFRRMNLGLGL